MSISSNQPQSLVRRLVDAVGVSALAVALLIPAGQASAASPNVTATPVASATTPAPVPTTAPGKKPAPKPAAKQYDIKLQADFRYNPATGRFSSLYLTSVAGGTGKITQLIEVFRGGRLILALKNQPADWRSRTLHTTLRKGDRVKGSVFANGKPANIIANGKPKPLTVSITL